MNPIGQRERLLLSYDDRLDRLFERLDKETLIRLVRLLSQFENKGGAFVYSVDALELLSKFKKEIEKELAAGYKSLPLRDFYGSISEKNIDLFADVTGRSNLKAIEKLVGELRTGMVDVVTSQIGEIPGLIAADLKKELFRNIVLGGTFKDTTDALANLITDSTQKRYASQIARDSIWQYDGLVQQKVADELSLDGFMFVGSIVDDSRDGCRHMVGAPDPVEICRGSGKKRTCRMEENRFKDIFLASGGFRMVDIPEIIERNKNDAGWNPNTTKENYLSLRNGYNCRHQIITYMINRDEARVQKLTDDYERNN